MFLATRVRRRHSGCPSVHHFDLNISTAVGRIAIKFGTNIHGSQVINLNYFGDVLTTIGWTAIKFCTHVPVSLGMDCNNFGDPITFYLAPSQGQKMYLSNILVYD